MATTDREQLIRIAEPLCKRLEDNGLDKRARHLRSHIHNHHTFGGFLLEACLADILLDYPNTARVYSPEDSITSQSKADLALETESHHFFFSCKHRFNVTNEKYIADAVAHIARETQTLSPGWKYELVYSSERDPQAWKTFASQFLQHIPSFFSGKCVSFDYHGRCFAEVFVTGSHEETGCSLDVEYGSAPAIIQHSKIKRQLLKCFQESRKSLPPTKGENHIWALCFSHESMACSFDDVKDSLYGYFSGVRIGDQPGPIAPIHEAGIFERGVGEQFDALVYIPSVECAPGQTTCLVFPHPQRADAVINLFSIFPRTTIERNIENLDDWFLP